MSASTKWLIAGMFSVLFVDAEVAAQIIGAVPAGEPTVVAQKVIHDNFDKSQCPLVVRASRIGDGSIKAFCNNGASFRIMNANGKDLAMNCVAAEKMGVKGC
jgi:hypothetical protein